MSIEKLDELLDDDTEICIDNLCWDYQGYMNDPHEETDDALDKSRSALRSRIREIKAEGWKEGVAWQVKNGNLSGSPTKESR